MFWRANLLTVGTAVCLVVFSSVPLLSQSSEEVARDLAAAEAGNPEAQFAAGWMYEAGKEVPKDFKKAAAWYEKAAGNGFAPALASLGYLYQTGSGVPQDSARAADLYKRAAEANDMSGQFNLGVAYINGIGVQRSPQLAAKWIHAAAEAGHQQSQLMLAAMLQQGAGVSKNAFAARRWFDRASKGPDPEIAGRARTIRQQIDDQVLFSGAFRREELAVLALIGFGLLAIMASGEPSSDASPYRPYEYKAPPRPVFCNYERRGPYLYRYCR